MAVQVCHLTSVHTADDPRIFVKECQSLAQHGYHVTLVALRGVSGDRGNVHVNVIPFSGGRIRRWLFGRKKVLRAAIQTNASLFHIHDPELLGIGTRLVQMGKKVIYDSHEDLPRQLQHKHYIPTWLSGWISHWAEKWENRHVRNLSAVVCATEHIRNRFLPLNALATTVRNYPSLSELEGVAGSPGAPVIVYIGSITRSRGIIELLNALIHTNAHLLLGGKFSPDSLFEEAQSHPAWSKVTYLGFLSREKVKDVLAQSGLGLVPLHPSPGYGEALPVKMFEYMAAGIPVITSDITLWKDILVSHHCGTATNIFDPVTFASTINSYIDDPERCRQEGIAGKQAVKRFFNWETEAKTLIQLYQQLLA